MLGNAAAARRPASAASGVDLLALLKAYQRQYLGAMYSGCGGGYLIVVANEPVPGAFKVNIRVAQK